METALISISLLCILFSLLKLLPHPHWSIRFFDFPQVQVWVLVLAFLLIDIIVFDFQDWWHWAICAALVATAVYQAVIVVPYTFLYPLQVPDSENSKLLVSVLVSNVYMNNRSYDRLIKLVKKKNPDIIVTLETDKKWEEGLTEIEKDYPHCVKVPQDNMYGLHVYSKLALEHVRVRYLVEDDIPSVRAEVRIGNDKRFTFYAVHPKPPSPTENEESTERDGELYLIADEIKSLQQPVILAGDLNDVAWSHSTRLFQRLSQLLDPRIGRGFFNTFHSRYPVFRWPLDHIFHSSHFSVNEIERLPTIGSDHFPMFISLSVSDDQDPAWMPQSADEDDQEEAQETILRALNKD